MEAGGRSYQDAICGAFVAALCYMRAKQHQQQQQQLDHRGQQLYHRGQQLDHHGHQLDHRGQQLESFIDTSSSSTSSFSSSLSISDSSRSSSAVTPNLSRVSTFRHKPIFVADPLSTDWTQLEVIDLINDGTGLGFGIIGGRSTGVVVKTILPGGVADQDGHLRTGDHILQIGDVNVRGMSSEQVALVLRQSGTHVRLVVARSVLEAPQFQIPHAPIIPTHQLEKHMEHFNAVMAMEAGEHELHLHNLHLQHQIHLYQHQQRQTLLGCVQVHPQPLEVMNEMASVDVFDVDLMKDSTGLGITIAGYVGGDNTPDEISGIFVKSVTDNSAADLDGRINVNDQIIEVDGKSLQGFSNQQAVEVLRNTGQMVRLKLVRFQHGPKFDKLQEYLAQANLSVTALPGSVNEVTSGSSLTYDQCDLQDVQTLTDDYSGEMTPDVEAAVKAAWEPLVGNDFFVVVAQLAKFKEAGGLGISLEGTVDVEDGVEVRPHHYIRSILPDGPVGLNGRLKSSDELLEVNGKRLLGLNHVSVVDILKDLPQHVRLVCARRKSPVPDSFSQHKTPVPGISPYHPGVEPHPPWTERLVKSKSELALSTSDHAISEFLSKPRSRSLEPMTGLAMWSSQPMAIDLEKGSRGLGFSVLEYQDPVNPRETVIVIRSLVPGGVAHLDGRLVPGDRLISVNSVTLEHATQADAVRALKAATRGTVTIGVAKLLPMSDEFKTEPQLTDTTTFNPAKLIPEAQVSQCETAWGRGLTDSSALRLHSQTDTIVSIQSEQHPTHTNVPASTNKDHTPNIPSDGFVDHNCLHTRHYGSSQERSFAFYASSIDIERRKDKSGRKKSLTEKEEQLKTCRNDVSVNTDVNNEASRVCESSRVNQLDHFKTTISFSPVSADATMPHVGKTKRELSKIQLVDSEHHVSVSNGPAAHEHQQKVHGTKNVEINLDNSQEVLQQFSGRIVTYITGPDQQSTTDPQTPTYVFAERHREVSAADVISNLAAPIAKLDSTDFESDQESPLQLPAVSPPLVRSAPTPPLTPPLRPAPCSPRRTDLESQRQGRSGIIHRKAGSTSSSEYVTPSDLKTPPNSPRKFYSGHSGFVSPELARVSPSLERTIHIHKSNLHLGLTVETIDKGVNGCVVKSIAKPSCVDKDGRIRPGDYIVFINNESLRGITNAQARAIFRRSSLTGSDITITYIPGEAVDRWQHTEALPTRSQYSPLKLAQSVKSEAAACTVSAKQPHESIQAAKQARTAPARQTSPSEAKPSITSGQKTLQTDGSFAVGNQTWGPPRTMQLIREPGKSLGISIVGGRVDTCNVSQEHSNAGIFIKHVLADSPAGENGTLKKGDRILEVNGCDVRNATHDEAVESIRNTSSIITFVVQSLSYSSCPNDLESSPARSPKSSKTPVLRTHSSTTSSPGHTPDQQTDAGVTESFIDSESEDEFGYTNKRIQKKYLDLPGTVHCVDINRGTTGIGLGLAGNKDRNTMSVFVAGVQPDSPAARDGRIQVGDEILEVNGINLHGLSHLNASAVIKGVNTPVIKFIIHRRESFLDHMAVKPLCYGSSTQFDVQHVLPLSSRGCADSEAAFSSNSRRESSATSYSHSSGAAGGAASSPSSSQLLTPADTIQVIILHKSSQGLGFGIQEDTKNGRHGIYVNSITQGGIADKDNQLEVGDEILEAGDKSFANLNYEKAIDFLRSAQGSVRLKVRKANTVSSLVAITATSCGKHEGTLQLLNTSGESTTDHLESSDPRTCPVALGKTTYIEIERGKTVLGLGIVGGSDTMLAAIIIHEVYDHGAAAKDGRLQTGDQILEVNGEDLSNATHAHALQLLCQTPSVAKLTVYRDACRVHEQDIVDIFSVDLIRRPGKGLGLSIVGKKNGAGIYISDIVKGSVAETDGRLMHGDHILAVNGEDLRNSTQESAATILKTCMGKVTLSIGRLKVSSKTSSRNNSNSATSLKKSDSSASSKTKSRHHSKNTSEDATAEEIDRDISESVGISSAAGDSAFTTASVSPRLPAVQSGKFKVWLVQ